jgi:ElaB/YqjD/DUF883 family membrane-anchored ribosome-binding protein
MVHPEAKPEAGTSTQGLPDGDKASQLERDIAKTRAEMTETIDNIEHKLSPERLKEEVKATMHETIDSVQERLDPRRLAKKAGRNMIDIIKENPLPSLIAGLSIGWLLTKGSDDSGPASGRYYGNTPDRRAGGSYGGYRGEEDRYDGSGYGRQRRPYASGSRRETYGDDWSTAQGRAAAEGSGGRSMMERASEKVHDVQDRSEEFVDDVWQGTRRAMTGVEGFIHHNPLAAGVIAVGLGALVGGLLPNTEQEDEWMGPARDRMVREAKDKASETLDKLEHVAQQHATEIREEVQEAWDDDDEAKKLQEENGETSTAEASPVSSPQS